MFREAQPFRQEPDRCIGWQGLSYRRQEKTQPHPEDAGTGLFSTTLNLETRLSKQRMIVLDSFSVPRNVSAASHLWFGS